MTETTILPVERPIELQCGRCGKVVYSATQWNYDRQAIRAAVDTHEHLCLNNPQPPGGNCQ